MANETQIKEFRMRRILIVPASAHASFHSLFGQDKRKYADDLGKSRTHAQMRRCADARSWGLDWCLGEQSAEVAWGLGVGGLWGVVVG